MLSEWKKCRKLPVVVEFREVTPEWFDSDESNQWCEKIHTREGVIWGYKDEDFIIRGIDGEIYPIKKNIFYRTYEVLGGE